MRKEYCDSQVGRSNRFRHLLMRAPPECFHRRQVTIDNNLKRRERVVVMMMMNAIILAIDKDQNITANFLFISLVFIDI